MAPEAASFSTQAFALLKKNLTYQKRNMSSNIRLILIPILFVILLAFGQSYMNKLGSSNGKAPEPITDLPKQPPLLQIPEKLVPAGLEFPPSSPAKKCRRRGTCPHVTMLITGDDSYVAMNVTNRMFPNQIILDPLDAMKTLPFDVLATGEQPPQLNGLDLTGEGDWFYVLTRCPRNSLYNFSIGPADLRLSCIEGQYAWRNRSHEVNTDLYDDLYGDKPDDVDGDKNSVTSRRSTLAKEAKGITAAYDFLDSDRLKFNVVIWYKPFSSADPKEAHPPLRVPRLVTLVSNAYLEWLRGYGTRILFDFVKDMPIHPRVFVDLVSILGCLFFTWVILQLFPVILTALVYEKQQKLRIMMKMHGLGSGPYWMITYAYFFVLSSIYIFCFVIFGSVAGLSFFKLNGYGIQFVFYFIYINMQISVAFLAAAMFSNAKTAAVVAYIFVFGTGLIGTFAFQPFIEDPSASRSLISALELFPGFSLFRGLYEFGVYSGAGDSMGAGGMQWGDLSDSANGLKEVLILMLVEWLAVLFVGFYIDKVISSGRGPFFFLHSTSKKSSTSFQKLNMQNESKVFADVLQEREKVEKLLLESSTSYAIISDGLKKVYPGRDGNPEKFAVRGLSIALSRGECFGMLGPNGAGKTTFISMMIGLTKPTSGTALVEGLDIVNQMDIIHSSMGVCPQDDLLWETLTGREHLLFYGSLKNLKGADLTQAVEESLKNVNLFHGGVADRQAGRYSGGMKRRLSVAISLIGNPKVVYLDEPSTGLDPASRNLLWNVVKRAKQDRAILLTTHSMEEAEALCDRLGIFVDGELRCIGDPKELKARYGGSYVFTVTTSSDHEEEVHDLVQNLCPNANRVYHISGTQKFELPKHEVKIADVFQAVEEAKCRFPVQAWGLADTTLEDVFIKVARGAEAFSALS